MQQRRSLTAHDLRRVAVIACADPRTVQSVLRGDKTVLPITRERVGKALAECGYVASDAESAERDSPRT